MATGKISGFLSRMGLTNPASTIQFLLGLGVAGLATSVVARLVAWLDWLPGWYLVGAAASFFFLVLAGLLALIPRVWFPKGPFAEYLGSAALMVGINEEIDKRVFRRVPQLKRECEHVAARLSRFVDEREQELPASPPPPPPGHDSSQPTPEQQQYNADFNAVIQKTASIYNSAWRRQVDRLFADARAMFFGPVPTVDRLPGRAALVRPEEIRENAIALGTLAETLPSNYSDQLHAARVERLRRLKTEGLALAYDIGEFLIRRQQEAAALTGSSPPNESPASRDRWERERAFDAATNTQFINQYAGRLRHVSEELRSFGLVDPAFDRLFVWPGLSFGGSVYELSGLPAVITALCQRIPYD